MAQYKGTMREAGRALHLIKKREKQKEQMEVLKQRIAEETIAKSQVDKKFSAHYDAVEAKLKSSTVGLVTLNDMKARQEALVREREMQLAQRARREQGAPPIHKGGTVQQFLKKALQALRRDFRELRAAGVEQLMFVMEDLILPHYHTFYDLIVAQARGKSGPLFAFDVHDDVRLLSDATREKDESHAGKVVLRSWYEKNKHIFPASRWEPSAPEKHAAALDSSESQGRVGTWVTVF
uniref:Protein FAM50B n=1 Tax=Camelus bactrianus TaxID=9837 RepID=A0A9W3FJP3_CAMBA|nr:protein FAM50B [Camelus bactrianus]